ncbi:glycosyltransferase family 2 protein [Geodermatophilus sp. SYSU D00703]
MAHLDVLDLRPAEPHHAGLCRGHIEFPEVGQTVDAHAVRVGGWVFGHVQPAVAVELLAGSDVIARAPVDVPRPDVVAAFPGAADISGFRAQASVVRADPALDLQVRAVLAGQERVPLARIRLRPVVDSVTTAPPPRVSVIIPCYNQARFLGDALASVAAQTQPAAEVIVVDDGSTDNTAEVAKRSPGVQFIRKGHAGSAAARNTGLRNATGDYLVFLDADDRLLPCALEVGLESLMARPEHAFVFGEWRLIGSDGSALETPERPRSIDLPYRAFLRMCFISTPGAVMYRRRVVDALGGLDEGVSPSEDYDLYLRITRTWPIYGHGRLVAEYRRHGSNVTLNRGLILRSESRVVRRQWTHVKHDQDLHDAYREGLRRVRDYHGGKLAQDVRSYVATGDWRRAADGALRLLWHHPLALRRGR